MAEEHPRLSHSPLSSTYQYQTDSSNIASPYYFRQQSSPSSQRVTTIAPTIPPIIDYAEDFDEEDTIAINPPLFPSVHHHQQQPSILYNYKNGHQPLSSSSSRTAHFDLLLGEEDEIEDDDGGDQTSSIQRNLAPSTHVTIQRVSSEDEFNFCSKRKRAKFVGPYLFGDLIGQGSYAKVKECLDRRNLCRRAVKIMQRRRLRKTPHGEKMAATEIRILKKLNHPNIIQLHDFIRNDEKQKLYLFIDLCVVSLQEMLDADQQSKQIKAFPTWQAHGYFVQLISGLEYLHSKFIIHNDIKPGNLLITVDHQLKITDFGTAEQLDMFSVDDTIKRSQGTPAFQCPEIANGDDTYSGFSIDIWACGVTLYNLVSGRLPFEADTIYLLFQTIGRGVYSIPDDLETHLTSLLHGLLHIDKRARFSLEQIKQHDWFRRRPPRTFDFLPFPRLALHRFQSLTMYDYLMELHQPSMIDNEEQEQLLEEDEQQQDDGRIHVGDGQISVLNASREERLPKIVHDEPPVPMQRHGHSLLNCGCSRTVSGENVYQSKTRNRSHHRLCTLS